MERRVWWGYANQGSINVAEGMASLWPLLWYANREADKVRQGGRRRLTEVHVVTDSAYVQTTGEAEDRLHRKKNGPLWEAFDCVERQGIRVHWHWIKRETAGLNQYADQLSKLVRVSFKAYNMQERLATGGGDTVTRTVYEVNPGV